MRKLKRGYDKCKGELPFKCFNCGQIGHIVSNSSFGTSSNKMSQEKEWSLC